LAAVGGATVARYFSKDSGGAIDVTLIEPSRTYYTCFFSNLYIGGFQNYDDLGHSYAGLSRDHGINVVHDWAVGIDRDARTVTLAGGGSVPYDQLILSPGIDFVEGSVPGWDLSAQSIMPHAYKGGRICELAGLTNDAGWAPVAPATMQSQMDENIHILGDASQQGDMPKSGYSANSQAKVAAMNVRGALTDSRVFPAKFSNTCWSLIATDDGVKVVAAYEATDEKIAKVSGFISETREEAALRKAIMFG
jgi:NADPH-dependent 2,4-dienoyl-CoA reductase/sulfur reductase-like enzyme